MANYFIYSVDSMTKSGELNSNIMLMDHEEDEEVYEVINEAKARGEIIISVEVTMYDENGDCVNERDITNLLFTSN